MTQAQALDILKMGRNVFITGPAGSGKTFVVNQYIAYLKEHNVSMGITASTGIAATHMGGITIHSWSGMGIKDSLTESDLEALVERGTAAKRIKECDVLIIDEVSMLHHFRLDTLNLITQHIRKNREPFGGLQVVLCGDFFQLPPVSRYGEPEAHFIYRSDAWRDGAFTVCYLHENYRQTNDGILSVLNEIRAGEVSEEGREMLKGRYMPAVQGDISEATRLFTHNIDVDTVNEKELSKVAGDEYVYEMTTRGKKPLVEALLKSCLAPQKLRLKKGARVMCVKNNFEKGYVNGTLGVVVACGHGTDPVIRTAATPDHPQGKLVTLEMAEWKIEDDGKVLASLSQYPLRLAWAITVHKSQGMSLDSVEVDLSRAFEPGMGYVALSRVRTLAGLSLIGINENALQVHPEVLEFDRELREMSEQAEDAMNDAKPAEIRKMQDAFLARCAPAHSIGGKKVSKLSTLEQTRVLVFEEKSLAEMAKERGVTAETIIGHLEKLVELGPDEEGIAVEDISYLKKGISRAHFSKIEKALEDVALADEDGDAESYKPPLLSPVKTRVGGNVSFKDIQLARVILGYIKKKSPQQMSVRG